MLAAGNHHQTTELAMGKPRILSVIMLVLLACGPEAGEGDDIPGKLEFEQVYDRVYRLDRRIDARFETENGERWECGFLTDRAYDDLESTLETLDPSVDYGYDPNVLECDRPGSLVYIEDFEHSPFECSWECCHSELRRAAWIYFAAASHFFGLVPNIDGEPYVAIEPDQPCPD